ncbi:hypothetical protein [Methanococcus voltae]|uniref:Uncharacterized protein n=2 Tax=Methanococcus voltae TaxID=2188 RepID=A0A8J7RFI9_METVO|nr:hypothetical protein [Methanococcus voltae]MBP2173121.1 hypothetical protein [Methanococcus voltae]MBP2202247.1 hypothetical protein [Methanococcus voltae]MCS3921941.1 hypothetical protein [Methanococcus voltae PS]
MSNFEDFKQDYEFEKFKKNYNDELMEERHETFEKTYLNICSIMGKFISQLTILDFKNEPKKKEILEIIDILEIELIILKNYFKKL